MIATSYFCCQCMRHVNLDIHGRCCTCNSSAIVEEPGEIEPVYLPERPGISRELFRLGLAIGGGVLVILSIMGVWWMLSGMPKWIH